jgi:pimeloyl-ACP methyl ester carboxylesterase
VVEAIGAEAKSYNFAVARAVGLVESQHLAPWVRPVRVPSKSGEFILTHKRDPRPNWNPSMYTFSPSDQFDVKGIYVSKRTVREGIGAPVVAVGKELNPRAREEFVLPRAYYGVSAVVRFRGQQAELAFEDPLGSETTRFGGRTVPLAADFTVPLATMLEDDDNNPKKQGLARLLHPGKYAETARISRLEPYDPNKTVILVIHGLMDSQATWTPLINELRGHEEIRRNFQFWFYSYPSGYPYPYSAAILRRDLDAALGRFPLRKPMVVMGHSMGGCISRLLITDTGEDLWVRIFGKTPAETQLSDESRKILTEALVFRHRPEIGRVIFISAPLKGSDLARIWVGRLGSKLVRTPSSLLSVGQDALKSITFQGDDLRLKRVPDSIDNLAPNNRFVKSINQIPITAGIPYHTIMGDRGKGNAPNSSDGVVPYWSSHMDGAVSEKIVPSNHSAHQNPEAIGEVHRILKLHAAESPRRQ